MKSKRKAKAKKRAPARRRVREPAHVIAERQDRLAAHATAVMVSLKLAKEDPLRWLSAIEPDEPLLPPNDDRRRSRRRAVVFCTKRIVRGVFPDARVTVRRGRGTGAPWVYVGLWLPKKYAALDTTGVASRLTKVLEATGIRYERFRVYTHPKRDETATCLSVQAYIED